MSTTDDQPVGGRMAARAREQRWMRVHAVLLVVLATALAAVAADVFAAPGPRAPAEPVAQESATGGRWYCPVTNEKSQPATVSVVAVGNEPSDVTVVRYRDGSPRPNDPVTVAPGEAVEVTIAKGDPRTPVAVRWRGGPAVATWRTRGQQAMAATCVPEPASSWHLTGFDTTLGSRSILHLFNPYTVDAVVRVRYATTEGPVDLVLTDNVTVEAGRSVRLNLNEFQPEQPDLGVTVEVLAGRIVTQGELRLGPPEQEQGPRGRTLVPATPALSESVSFAYAVAGQGAQSWISVLNPAQREAAVEVRVSQPRQGTAREEVSVPAGGVVRIDLAELSSEPVFGVTLVGVNGLPMVANRFTVVTDENRTGLAAAGGARTPVRSWVLPGAGPERVGTVALHNPGGEPTTVQVDAGANTPEEWSQLSLAPNGHRMLDLARARPGRGSAPVLVTADQPVVVELRSDPGDDAPPAPWTLAGVPLGLLEGPGQRLPVRRDPLLDTRPAGTIEPQPQEPGPAVTPVPSPGTEAPSPTEAPTGTERATPQAAGH